MSKVLIEKQALDIQVSRWCPERVYVEVLVPEDIHAVSQIVFRTESHDQGYSGEPQFHGTYKNSYTWFEAVAISPSGHERCPRRTVQYNVHASSEYKHHEVIWDTDSEDPSIREWVRSVRSGDAVQLIPKAQWPGWINFVREAEIEVRGSKLARPAMCSVEECYRPLQASEIRLLVLDSGAEDEPVACSLTCANVRQQPTVAYEALSYCWGDPRETREIFVRTAEDDGAGAAFSGPLRISASLFSALNALRPRDGPGRVLWVDAICVNQDDLDERSSQVALMGNIYRQARQVVVWLGEGDAGTHKSLQIINGIDERYRKQSETDASHKELSLQDPAQRDQVLAAVHGPWLEHDNHYAFIEEWSLFRAPWFHRTWIVQEIFNAERSVLCCGADTVSWDTLLQVNKCIPRRNLTMKSATRAIMPPIFNTLFDARTAPAGGGRLLSTNLAILEVLTQGLDLEATDPRDKLFAMLQFGRETSDFASLSSAIVPDYNRPAADVFALFTKWWIAEHRSLRILSAIQALEGRTWQETRWGACQIPPSVLSLPSWSWGYRGHSNWAMGLLGLSHECEYRASGDTTPDLGLLQLQQSSSAAAKLLSLTGFRIGVVSDTRPYPYFRGPTPGFESLHRAYLGIFDPLNLTGKSMHQLKSQHDQNYMDIEPETELIGHFHAHGNFAQRTAGVECISQCFYSTQEGFVGLCPYSTQPGDWIVILHGGLVPYILRPRDEEGSQHEFVGECYAQGYMQGQGIEEQRKKGIPSVVFSLI